MSSSFFLLETDRTVVQVEPAVTMSGDTVGIIALSLEGKGWTELTPADARRLGAALMRAADATESRATSG